MTDTTVTTVVAPRVAVLDDAHIGDIQGALGTIRLDDHGERRGLSAKPARTTAPTSDGPCSCWCPCCTSTKTWCCASARSPVSATRLSLERFGKFWGAFSVIDLFLLNAPTLVTEFIGITLSAGYLGRPRAVVVVLAP